MTDQATAAAQEHVARGIVRAGWEAVRGELPTPNEYGYCLKLVRLIIERAMGWQDSELYRRYVDRTWVAPPDYPHASGHWARDLERALRDAGMAVSGDRSRPGDILCNYEAAWSARWGASIGHVAVLLDHELVLENVNPAFRAHRHAAVVGALCLTPRAAWGDATTVLRFDPSRAPA